MQEHKSNKLLHLYTLRFEKCSLKKIDDQHSCTEMCMIGKLQKLRLAISCLERNIQELQELSQIALNIQYTHQVKYSP